MVTRNYQPEQLEMQAETPTTERWERDEVSLSRLTSNRRTPEFTFRQSTSYEANTK